MYIYRLSTYWEILTYHHLASLSLDNYNQDIDISPIAMEIVDDQFFQRIKGAVWYFFWALFFYVFF